MQRINTPSSVEGKFISGVLPDGSDATNLSPTWCNDVQEEVCHAIEDFGIELDPANDHQLAETINNLINRRNLSFNSRFLLEGNWGTIPLTISIPTVDDIKTSFVGLVVDNSSTATISNLVVEQSGNNGLSVTGVVTNPGTLRLRQIYSSLGQESYSTTPLNTTNVTKIFTSSVEFEKVSGVDFRVNCFLDSIAGNATNKEIVEGDSTVTAKGLAYQQVDIDPVLMGSTPVKDLTTFITFTSNGAFELMLDNMQFFEGRSTPPAQVFGNDIVDRRNAEYIINYYRKSGYVKRTLAIHKAVNSTDAELWYSIPIDGNLESSDVVNVSIQGTPIIYKSGSDSIHTINNQTINIVKNTSQNTIEILFSFFCPDTEGADQIELAFTWDYSKP